ncbi:MAG: PilZ domain-containing protein [Bdellovibrionales bacterium]|nr:PilZ domain-containing protein [Bdellovibrionales bacterium]
MQKILLQCRSLDEANQLKNFYESRLPYAADVSFGFNDSEAILTSFPIHLFVWDTQNYHMEQASWIKELRGMGFIYPILVLSENIDMKAMKGSVANDKIHFLERPFEYKALKGITLKLMQSRNLPQQMFKRFKTNQPLSIESYSTGEQMESSMFNLSVGGAYFEAEKKPSASIGDLVKLQVNLNDVDKSHMMNARIVWTTRKGAYSGGYGVGVKFVRNEEIYKQLLEKM